MQGGVRIPKFRIITSTVSLTTRGTIRRGKMTRGLGQRTPGASSVWSQIRHVAPGTPWIFKKINGSGVWTVSSSRCGSVPYRRIWSTLTNHACSASSTWR